MFEFLRPPIPLPRPMWRRAGPFGLVDHLWVATRNGSFLAACGKEAQHTRAGKAGKTRCLRCRRSAGFWGAP